MNCLTEQDKQDWEDLQFINELKLEFEEARQRELDQIWESEIRKADQLREIEYNKSIDLEFSNAFSVDHIKTEDPKQIKQPKQRGRKSNIIQEIIPDHYFNGLKSKVIDEIPHWKIIDIIRPLSPSKKLY